MKDKILVVDDEEPILDLLHQFLEGQGYEVTTASSGEDALEIVRSGGRFAAVISDVQMRGMSGWDFYVAAVQINRDLMDRFIFATGKPGSEEAEPIVASGKRLLTKPYLLPSILAQVHEVIAGK